jgi:hypothetical protein
MIPLELQRGFNIGAFCFGIVWTLFHTPARNRWIAAGWTLVAGPLTLGLAALGYNVWLGFNANRLAAAYGNYESVRQFEQTQREWRRWAVIVIGSVLGSIALYAILGTALVGVALVTGSPKHITVSGHI